MNPPYLGRGIAFPLRLNPATGGLLVTEGRLDGAEIAVQYLPDGYTIRNEGFGAGNHVAESIAHILQVIPGERDTLPEFGSRIHDVLHDPNNVFTQQEYEVWVELATEKWEKRARIPIPEGVRWRTTAEEIDENKSIAMFSTEIILGQVPGNLVAPFVSERDARSQHYPLGETDSDGHDWCSRYRNSPTVENEAGERYLRPRRSRPITMAPDDEWHKVQLGDTWLKIAHRIYGEFRLWWAIAETYYHDLVNQGAGIEESMDTLSDPEPGTILRVPSRTRVLMEWIA